MGVGPKLTSELPLMSLDYAARLSKYKNKGVCGLPEVFDSAEELGKKCVELAELLRTSRHAVFHTGAGVSTSAGIPDFRGPQGVWTLEQRKRKVEGGVSFTEAQPTPTHRAIQALVAQGMAVFVVSQNVDGLHLKSGLSRDHLAELHGNVMIEKCERCGREYVRNTPVPTIGLKHTGGQCQGGGARGTCRGRLRDTVLDWEDPLPQSDLEKAEQHSKMADLAVCLGTTLQIEPAGKLPLLTKENGGKIVLCNLQSTKLDDDASLIIHSYVDEIMTKVLGHLGLELQELTSTPVQTVKTEAPAPDTSPFKCIHDPGNE